MGTVPLMGLSEKSSMGWGLKFSTLEPPVSGYNYPVRLCAGEGLV